MSEAATAPALGADYRALFCPLGSANPVWATAAAAVPPVPVLRICQSRFMPPHSTNLSVCYVYTWHKQFAEGCVTWYAGTNIEDGEGPLPSLLGSYSGRSWRWPLLGLRDFLPLPVPSFPNKS